MVKASDISDEEFKAALDRSGGLTSIWELEQRLPYPPKVILAKARTLIRKGRGVNGCYCGCRGDFYLTNPVELEYTVPTFDDWLRNELKKELIKLYWEEVDSQILFGRGNPLSTIQPTGPSTCSPPSTTSSKPQNDRVDALIRAWSSAVWNSRTGESQHK